MAEGVTKVQMPEGTETVSHDGVLYKVARDGSVEVPDAAAAVLVESHGAKVWQPPKAK